MDKKWNCYDCFWSTDKCKNNQSDQYNKFLQDIEECNLLEKCNPTGEVDNSSGCSLRKLSDAE